MERLQQVHKRMETDNGGRTIIHWLIKSLTELRNFQILHQKLIQKQIK